MIAFQVRGQTPVNVLLDTLLHDREPGQIAALTDRPLAVVDRGKPLPEPGEVTLVRRHGRDAVVRDAVEHLRRHEIAELLKQAHELGVAVLRDRRGRACATRRRKNYAPGQPRYHVLLE